MAKRRSNSKTRGITLLEVLLVLVVGASLLMAGYRQYIFMRQDVDLLSLQSNVDTIFSAMALYYKKNCNGQVNPLVTPSFTPGTLHPQSNPDNPRSINMQDDLVATGLLATTLSTIVHSNPLVDTSSGLGEYGYVVQFNQYTHPRYLCQTAQDPNKPATGPEPEQNCAQKLQVGTIIMWRPQVAVLLKNVAAVNTYLAVAGADCLSSIEKASATSPTVYPCSANKPGNYLVWERSPSLAAPKASANFWIMNPTAQQFNQMYTTYPINYLLNTNATGTTGNTPDDKQYFLCGG